MRKHSDRRRYVLHWLLLFGFPLWSTCCVQHATPTATPLPTPDSLDIYAMLTESYTSFEVIVRIYDMSADEGARMLRALQSVQPPAGLEALHEQALDAYRYICHGKLLLPGANGVLRAEAHFMVDWGISRLLDYREQLDGLRQQRTRQKGP